MDFSCSTSYWFLTSLWDVGWESWITRCSEQRAELHAVWVSGIERQVAKRRTQTNIPCEIFFHQRFGWPYKMRYRESYLEVRVCEAPKSYQLICLRDLNDRKKILEPDAIRRVNNTNLVVIVFTSKLRHTSWVTGKQCDDFTAMIVHAFKHRKLTPSILSIGGHTNIDMSHYCMNTYQRMLVHTSLTNK